MATRSFGKYSVIEPLGRGGMAEVYRARDTMLGRDVALKVIHQHLASDRGFMERFRREAQLVASLRHPNIVQIFDFDVVDAQPFMVMEFLDGGSLKDRMQRLRERDEQMPLLEISRLLGQLAGALDYAHAVGAIHRDIKPANVMYRGADQAIITDFGVAKMLGEVGSVTIVGTVIGSPTYMSPEQAAGRAVDARSDLYSLGVIVYQLATGRAPFESGNPAKVVSAHLNEPTPPPREFNPALSEAVQRVILRAMAKDPAYRFKSAAELADAFRGAVRGLNPADSANDLARGLRLALSNQAAPQPLGTPPPKQDEVAAPAPPTPAPPAAGRMPAFAGDATVVEPTSGPQATAAGGQLDALRTAPTEVVRRPAGPPPSSRRRDTAPASGVGGDRQGAQQRSITRIILPAAIALIVVLVAAIVLLMR